MIHRARPEDVGDLALLEGLAFGPEAWSAASLAGQLADADSWLALIRHPDGWLQASMILRRAADEAELLRVGVHPSARRRGLAAALLAHGCTWARQRGAGRLFLEVSAANHVAIAFYRAQGFSRCGRRRAYYGPDEDALLLELGLASREHA